jgi:DNA-binding response OmpR family regulator
MPEMDGYETCERLKSDKRYRHIPVIFLTAKTETEDIVKGFHLGGLDYVTKPCITEELLARVKTHVQMKTLKSLLPICAQCKKIRDEEGLWNQIEIYIEKHTDSDFSHGMCEECAEKLYGDQEWFKKRKNKGKST